MHSSGWTNGTCKACKACKNSQNSHSRGTVIRGFIRFAANAQNLDPTQGQRRKVKKLLESDRFGMFLHILQQVYSRSVHYSDYSTQELGRKNEVIQPWSCVLVRQVYLQMSCQKDFFNPFVRHSRGEIRISHWRTLDSNKMPLASLDS